MEQMLRPLKDLVLVERLEANSKTAGGILIPDNAKETPTEGIVIAVGQGKFLENGKRRTVRLQVGDRVIFGKWGGNEVKVSGKNYLLVKEEEVLAVVEN